MRLFIGVILPEEIRSKLLLLIKGETISNGIRWVDRDNLHLTLKFLGEVPGEKAEEVANVLRLNANKNNAFGLKLVKGGVFPSVKKPKVFWIGVSPENDKLGQLVQSIENELHAIGFPKEEKSYVPHITVGRLKKDVPSRKFMTQASQFCKLLESYQSPNFMVKEFHLIQSHLFQGGVKYEIKKTFQLRDS